MHVLGGKYKNRLLQSSVSPKVKPTVRRLRESLMAYLGDRIVDARFLDLCAGSGSVGIEALSRGAAHATFVDRSVKFCHFIMANLDLCEVPDECAEVVAEDAVAFLQRAAKETQPRWDVVYYDPPYEIDYGPVLAELGRGKTLARRAGLLVIEHLTELEIPVKVGEITLDHQIIQGDSALSFFVCA
jgi:16S rRNA (guanine966-N2)-methyltransferase